MKKDVVLGDGGYLLELERRGYVDSGSGREKVGTGRGSGQFTPEVAIENPDALAELHRELEIADQQQTVRVAEVVLFRSELLSEGSRHTVVSRHRFV